ncbi:BspA family leucine-rich repeat surface protein [Helicobacter mehlei]|uniref:BspA family leucine-rich repeat surface protein n=1 Tax=Helicobacter mehlei TaxID=2316080 RepID=UPI001F27D220|nr:BspA family leucine-rich repeat surface protein [Helicobacter mehlei]
MNKVLEKLEELLSQIKHAGAKRINIPPSVSEGLKKGVTKLEEVLTTLKSHALGENPAVPHAKKYCPQNKEELKKLAADESVHLGEIDISQITDLSFVFSHATSHGDQAPAFMRKDFEGLENWDVSHVSNMEGMFYRAILFNHDISSWDVSKVEKMNCMFKKCAIFNQPLNSWNVSSVTDMGHMFYGCEDFNQPLDKWDVSNVHHGLGDMFKDCASLKDCPAWYQGKLEQ